MRFNWHISLNLVASLSLTMRESNLSHSYPSVSYVFVAAPRFFLSCLVDIQKQDKRKSVPVKRPQPSVTTSQTPQKDKKPRLSFDLTAASTTTAIMSPVHPQHQQQNSMDGNSRSNSSKTAFSKKAHAAPAKPKNNKLIRDFFTSAVKKNILPAIKGNATAQQQQDPSIGCIGATVRGGSLATGPLGHPVTPALQLPIDSQPPTAPSRISGLAATVTHPRIMSFAASTAAVTGTGMNRTDDAETEAFQSPLKPSRLQLLSSSMHMNTVSTIAVDKLQMKIHELTSNLHEKDEQLKAVSNNQTILHTALKQALSQKQNEFDSLKKHTNSRTKETSKLLEHLIRTETVQTAKELRDKLASDGERLGRLVYTRAGFSGVETWEEGWGSRNLKKKRIALHKKRQDLEQRQVDAKRVAARFLPKNHHIGVDEDKNEKATNDGQGGQEEVDNANSTASAKVVVGGILVNNALTAMESIESVRLHLATIRQQERELAEEDQVLYDEKGTHIRNLKRVASEDASRFKSRPKVSEI